MKRILIHVTFLLALLTTTTLHAQITIGSSEKPADGALLQLKNIDGITNEDANASKGLGLPRVILSDPNKLKIGTASEITDPDEIKSHVGLLVYNIMDGGGLCKGLHVWNGSKWEPLGGFSPEMLNIITPSDTRSNAFIIPLNKGIDIPVKKAYDMWKSNAMLGNLDLTGEVTAEVHWADAEGLVTAMLRDGDQGENSVIRVAPGCTTQTLRGGNAVVAVRVGGVVRWSWHIWVTDYDPDNGGKTFTYNNGTDSNVFMDRNLGALSTDPQDGYLTLGNTYEWGRKDPFSHPAGLEGSNTETGGALEIPLYGVKTAIYRITSDDSAGGWVTNLKNSITDPLQYIGLSGWFASNNSGYTDQDGDFWGASGVKGDFDPCPAGWRVPQMVGGRSPLDGLTSADATLVGTVSTAGAALDFSTKLGLFPLAGGRFNGGAPWAGEYNGNRRIGQNGVYWLANSGSINAAETFRFDFYSPSVTISPSGQDRKAYGLSIRCVKE